MPSIGRPSNIANVVYKPNAQLSRIAIQYPAQEFIADKALPALRVQNESDFYYTFKPSHLDLVDDHRAISALPNEVSWEIDETPQYVCQERALEEFLPDRIRANTDPAIQADVHTVEDLTHKTLIAQEYRASALYSDNATAFENSVTNKWDDPDTKDIEAVMKAAIRQVRYAIGMKPNTMILNSDVYDALSMNPTMRELFKYLPVPVDTVFSVEKMFGHMFGIQNILVAGALYNGANKGQEVDLQEVWGNNVYLAYLQGAPALMKPSFCYRILTKERQISSLYDNRRNGTIYRITGVQTEHVVMANACLKLEDVLTGS